MNKLILSLICGSLVFASTGSFATQKTSLKGKWNCTTNASTSDVAADKASDNKMSTDAMSSSKSFSFAAKNCRDCTKITCELKK
jgi:hypothetical protein